MSQARSYIKFRNFFVFLPCLYLIGCSAMNALINDKDLNVTTQMSDTIFLPPSTHLHHTIFVEAHNTSGDPRYDISSSLIQALKDKGYTLVDTSWHADFLVQVRRSEARRVG